MSRRIPWQELSSCSSTAARALPHTGIACISMSHPRTMPNLSNPGALSNMSHSRIMPNMSHPGTMSNMSHQGILPNTGAMPNSGIMSTLEPEVDHCSGSPCINGGMCVNTADGNYTCLCRNQWTGPNCEIGEIKLTMF